MTTGYVLEVDEASIDVNQFEADAEEGRALLRDDPAGRRQRSCNRPGHGKAQRRSSPSPAFRTRRDRPARVPARRIEDRIDADLRAGKASEVVAELRAASRGRPLRERLVSLLVLALSGRTPCGGPPRRRPVPRHLGEELGIEPSPELRRPGGAGAAPRPRSASAFRRGGARRRTPTRRRRQPLKSLHPFHEAGQADDFFGRDHLVTNIISRLTGSDRLLAPHQPRRLRQVERGAGRGAPGAAARRRGCVRPGTVGDPRHGARVAPGRTRRRHCCGRAPTGRPTRSRLGRRRRSPPRGLTGVARGQPSAAGRRQVRRAVHPRRAGGRPSAVHRQPPRTQPRDRHRRIHVMLTLQRPAPAAGVPGAGSAARRGGVQRRAAAPRRLRGSSAGRRGGLESRFEPALLADLLTDVVGEPARSIFQYALTELFKQQVGGDRLVPRRLPRHGRRTRGARRRAEEVSPNSTRCARPRPVSCSCGWSPLASTTTGPAAGPSPPSCCAGHRRRRPAGHPSRSSAATASSPSTEPVTGHPTVEVAHEALLFREWDRLQGWIDTGRQDVRRHASLRAAMADVGRSRARRRLPAERNPAG